MGVCHDGWWWKLASSSWRIQVGPLAIQDIIVVARSHAKRASKKILRRIQQIDAHRDKMMANGSLQFPDFGTVCAHLSKGSRQNGNIRHTHSKSINNNSFRKRRISLHARRRPTRGIKGGSISMNTLGENTSNWTPQITWPPEDLIE